MEVMLDTNAYCDWLRDGRWGTEIATAEVVGLSTIVIGELYHGFHGGARFARNVEVLTEFLSQPAVRVVDVNIEMAEVFGEMMCLLVKQGVRLPTNDIWIAAAAHVRGAVLLTSDQHFDRLPQVRRKRAD